MCQPLSDSQVLAADKTWCEWVDGNEMDPFGPLATLFRRIVITGGDYDCRGAVIKFMAQDK